MLTRKLLVVLLWLSGCSTDSHPGSDPGSNPEPRSLRGPGLLCTPLASPASIGSSFPTLQASPDQLYLSWIDAASDTPALRWASWDGNEEQSWSAPETIIAGDQLFVNWADFPGLVSVLANRRDLLLAYWLEKRAGEGYDALFSWRLADGWTEPRRLHEDNSDVEHGFVSAAQINRSEVAAIWLDGRQKDSTALYMRSLPVDGGAPGPEQLLDPRVCSCCQTSLVETGPQGGWRVAYRDRSADEVRDISWISSEQPNPATVHGDGWKIEGCPVNGPRLTPWREEGAVAWFTNPDEGPGQVYLAFQNEDCNYAAPIDVDDGHPVGRVDTLLTPEGAVVSWMEYSDGEKDATWRCRVVDRSTRPGDELRPSVTIAEVDSGRSSGFLRLWSGPGGMVAAWTTDEPAVALAQLALVPEDE